MKLMDFQKRFILDVYDNPAHTKTAILSMARKNGKTALIAGLLLAHLVGPAAVLNSQIISGAMSRDQASLVFKLAQKIINQSGMLQDVIKVIPSQKSLIGLPMNVEYRAIAADGRTAQGLSPVLVIFDEAGQIKGPQNDFYEALVTSQGAHDHPLMINISTQAPTDADLLSIMIDDAKAGDDPRTVCHVYEAPEECDVLDREAWATANPALGVFRSMQDMEDLANAASRMPSKENSYRNLNLNQRVNAEAPFVSPQEWKACIADYDETPFLEGVVWGGLDLSMKTDLTAFVMLAEYEGKFYTKAEIYTPK
ncbi:terminase TerL endonuclease subunit, partial [Snodgrassella sp. CFCC 13594]|uniref:terminase TerL endonuclease subunit n=1 Tax=Snodgrassella sp. CFCC 13594 TaxID=1775559 RepID=UPI001E2B29C5